MSEQKPPRVRAKSYPHDKNRLGRPKRDYKVRILKPSNFERIPKVPVRRVKNIPEEFSTLLYYDHTGVIFCSACNMYVKNIKTGLNHCRSYHYKKDKSTEKPEGERTP